MTAGLRPTATTVRRTRRRAVAVVAVIGLAVGSLGWASASSEPARRPVVAPAASGGSVLAALVTPRSAASGPDAPVPAIAPGSAGAAVAGPTMDVGGSGVVARASADPVTAPIVADLRASLVAADAGEPMPDEVSPEPAELQGDADPLPGACTAEPGERRHQVCVVGDPDGARSAALIGSSHIMMWLPGLRAEARRAGIRLSVFVKYGCAPFTFAMRRDQQLWTECNQWRDWAIDRLDDDPPELVIAGSHAWVDIASPDGSALRGPAFDDAWSGGVRGLVASLAPVVEAGGRITVLGDTSRRTRRPGGCAQRRRATVADCEQRLTLDTVRLNALTRRATEGAGGSYYDPNELVCVDTRCPAVAGGRFVFRDTLGHVSATYSRHVGPALAARVGLTR